MVWFSIFLGGFIKWFDKGVLSGFIRRFYKGSGFVNEIRVASK